MSDGRRFALICGVGLMLPSLLPGTHSWVTFLGRPILALLVLCVIAPWRGS